MTTQFDFWFQDGDGASNWVEPDWVRCRLGTPNDTSGIVSNYGFLVDYFTFLLNERRTTPLVYYNPSVVLNRANSTIPDDPNVVSLSAGLLGSNFSTIQDKAIQWAANLDGEGAGAVLLNPSYDRILRVVLTPFGMWGGVSSNTVSMEFGSGGSFGEGLNPVNVSFVAIQDGERVLKPKELRPSWLSNFYSQNTSGSSSSVVNRNYRREAFALWRVIRRSDGAKFYARGNLYPVATFWLAPGDYEISALWYRVVSVHRYAEVQEETLQFNCPVPVRYSVEASVPRDTNLELEINE